MVESEMHRTLKQVTAILCDGNYCSYEYGCLMGGLRVDVRFVRKHREYFVECETHPNIKRLQDKGRRRNKIRNRNVYVLIAPTKTLIRLSLKELRGYFDKVYGYEAETGSLTLIRDLRVLGGLRDKVLDRTYPSYACRVSPVLRQIKRCYWRIRNMVRGWLQCFCCRHDIPHPWSFCPRDDCPMSRLPYLEDILYLDDDS